MAELATIPILLAVLASYLLVLWAYRKGRPSGLVEFLFRGNSAGLAISSGVGSLFSVSIACTALLSAGYLYGWQILLSSVAGTATGTLALLKVSRSPRVLAFKARQTAIGFGGGASFLALQADESESRYPAGLALLLIAVYTAVLASELAVVRVTSASLISLGRPELIAVLLMLIGICFSYVFIGGYRAVLLTDHFQVLVIAGFFGILCGEIDWGQFDLMVLASPAKSALAFPTIGHQLALHLASFVGSASLVLGSTDHWLRTVGTLRLRDARVAIAVSSALGAIAGSVLVFAGTYFARLNPPHAPIAGQGSLELLAAVVGLGSKSLAFAFFAALSCVVLTTIDTYMITQQQLYFEFVCRSAARTARGYLVEYILRWRQVRFVGLLLLIASFTLSLWVPGDRIYVVGVAALSTPIVFSPLVLRLALAPRLTTRNGSSWPATAAVCLSFSVWPPSVLCLTRLFGSVESRLYLLPLGLFISTMIGYLLCLAVAVFARRRSGVDDL